MKYLTQESELLHNEAIRYLRIMDLANDFQNGTEDFLSILQGAYERALMNKLDDMKADFNTLIDAEIDANTLPLRLTISWFKSHVLVDDGMFSQLEHYRDLCMKSNDLLKDISHEKIWVVAIHVISTTLTRLE